MSKETNNQEGKEEVQEDQTVKKFYKFSQDYWAKQPATVNGMLGGFDYVSKADIDQSQNFLNYFTKVKIIQYIEY